MNVFVFIIVQSLLQNIHKIKISVGVDNSRITIIESLIYYHRAFQKFDFDKRFIIASPVKIHRVVSVSYTHLTLPTKA